ncbi:hypothetical protein GW17_00022024 [Ensete ventricosum]|nr:hypothetical protein GW17_00022024 [Ensete ventricosum]
MSIAVIGEPIVAGGKLLKALGGDASEVPLELRVLRQDHSAPGHEAKEDRIVSLRKKPLTDKCSQNYGAACWNESQKQSAVPRISQLKNPLPHFPKIHSASTITSLLDHRRSDPLPLLVVDASLHSRPSLGMDPPSLMPRLPEMCRFPMLGMPPRELAPRVGRIGGDALVEESTVTEQCGGSKGRRRRRDLPSSGGATEDESSKLVSTSSGNELVVSLTLLMWLFCRDRCGFEYFGN